MLLSHDNEPHNTPRGIFMVRTEQPNWNTFSMHNHQTETKANDSKQGRVGYKLLTKTVLNGGAHI